MPDYTNLSAAEVFSSFDTNKTDGIIDKKEAKLGKTLYGGVFSVKIGMTLQSFETANNKILVDKDIHSSLFNKIEFDKLPSSMNMGERNNTVRALIRKAGTHLGLLGQKIEFKNIEKFIKKSDRIENLKNAFKFLDIMDCIGNESKNFVSDNFIDVSKLQVDKPFEYYLLAGPTANNILGDPNKIKERINQLNLNCTPEDVETVLMAIYHKFSEQVQRAY